jgi:hypothetical protein
VGVEFGEGFESELRLVVVHKPSVEEELGKWSVSRQR